MKKRNLLVVPEGERFLEQYKEEIAHEFGIHRTVAETDTLTEITKRLAEEAKNEEKEE